MTIVNSTNDLQKYRFSILLTQPAFFQQQIKQVTATTVLHDVHHILLHHKSTKILNDIFMLKLFDTFLLSINSTHIRCISIGFWIHKLYRYLHICFFVCPEHDQPESSLTKFFCYFIFREQGFLIEIFTYLNNLIL